MLLRNLFLLHERAPKRAITAASLADCRFFKPAVASFFAASAKKTYAIAFTRAFVQSLAHSRL